MQFLNLSESDRQSSVDILPDYKLSYSYKQLLPFIVTVCWKQLLISVAFHCMKAAKNNFNEKLFFPYECKD